MKKLGLIGLVLALALAVFALSRLMREGERAPAVAEAPDAPESAATSAPELAASTLDRADVDASEAPREKLPAAATSESGLENWDLSRSIWVEGTVRMPAGCVDDGPVEVFAAAGGLDADALALALDFATKGQAKPFLSRRPVDADGSFKVPFPPETQRGYVTVRGRYAYLTDSVEVIFSAPSPSVTLEPTCGASIVGTVELPAESPVAIGELDGQRVTVRTSADEMRGAVGDFGGFHRRVKLAAGRFEFRAVPAGHAGTLEILPDRLAAASIEVEKLESGRERSLTVALQRGGTVRGIVRDAERQPIAAAKVEAALPGRWFGFDNRTVREGTSSSDGSFELASVASGKLVLRANKDGYLDSEPAKFELAEGGVTSGLEVELSRGSSVSGTVTWPDGKPVASIKVDAEFDVSQMFGMGAFNALRGRDGDGQTDAQGAFTITGLGKGPFVVEAHAPPPGEAGGETGGEAPAEPQLETFDPKDDGEESDDGIGGSKKPPLHWRARVDGVQPGASGLALVLRAPQGLAGRVVDDTGAGVAKFSLEAAREGKGPMGSFLQESHKESFEDAEGRFLLPGLTEGTWKFYAVAEGFALPEPVSVEIPRAADAEEVVIALVRAASVAGVVKDSAGLPVAGAAVALDTGEPPWKARMQGGPKQPEAKSAADGAFLLAGLRPGKVRVVGDSKAHARSLPAELELAAGQRVEGIELVLRAGGKLTGQVFGEGGRPSKGLLVQATEMKVFDTQMTFSGGEGEFELEHLEPGTWQVVAMPTRNDPAAPSDDSKSDTDDMMSMVSKMKTAMVDIADGEETHVVLGAPPKDPVRVFGQVTHAGEPSGGAMIVFVGEGKEGLKGMKTSQVEKDGRYSIDLDAPGGYDVTIQKLMGGMGQQSSIEFTRDVPEAKEHRLDFALPTARISGRIRGPDGEPAAGVRVSLQPESSVEAGSIWGGHYHEGVADGEGHYDIQMLRAGTYTVSAGGTTLGGIFGGDEKAFGREVRAGLRLDDGEWMRDVDFRLERAGEIEVAVVDAGGAAAAEASIFVRDANGRLVDGFSFVSTDVAGKAKYRGLAPGSYTVSARKELLASVDDARVKVAEGEKTGAQVALQPGTMLLVSFVGAESKPVKASISVQDEQGRELSGMVSMADVMKMFTEGGFSTTERKIGPLPQGKYKVRATGPDGKTVTKPVNLTGQAERKLTLHFD